MKLYDQVIEQVIVLNEIRETKRLEQNKGMSRFHLPDVAAILLILFRSGLHA